jgi:hypothetical protein
MGDRDAVLTTLKKDQRPHSPVPVLAEVYSVVNYVTTDYDRFLYSTPQIMHVITPMPVPRERLASQLGELRNMFPNPSKIYQLLRIRRSKSSLIKEAAKLSEIHHLRLMKTDR